MLKKRLFFHELANLQLRVRRTKLNRYLNWTDTTRVRGGRLIRSPSQAKAETVVLRIFLIHELFIGREYVSYYISLTARECLNAL